MIIQVDVVLNRTDCVLTINLCGSHPMVNMSCITSVDGIKKVQPVHIIIQHILHVFW